jgi:hypothetical protein
MALAPAALAASPTETGQGILTAIDPDGSLVISDRGYQISPYAIIRDGIGRKVELKDLQLPLPVIFEYGHSPRGPVIKVLKEFPQ